MPLNRARLCIWVITLIAAFSIATQSARAGGFEIQEAQIEKGEVELEAHGAHFSGFPGIVVIDEDDLPPGQPEPLENEIIRHGLSLEAELGLTEWLLISAEVELEEERNEDGTFGDFELSEVGIGMQIELVERKGNGFGAAFAVEYETPIGSETTREQDGDEPEVEKEKEGATLSFGPIVEVVRGPISATANLYFAYVFEGDLSVSEFEDGDLENFEASKYPDYWNFNYAIQVKYQVNNMFGVGVEAFGELADIGGDIPSFPGIEEPDKHRIGPVLYFNFGNGDEDEEGGNGEEEESENGEEAPEISLAAGVLFGLNDETADVAVKWDVEIEF